MKKVYLIAIAGFSWFNLAGLAIGQTVVPLNTGFKHTGGLTGSLYALGARDDFWINIASSLPTSPPADRTWTIQSQLPWQPALPAAGGIPGTNWISARSTIGGNVDPVTKTGYTIFRKCFCMMSFSQAKLSFNVRADDNISIWLNTTLNTLVAPVQGAFSNATPLQGGTTDQTKFRIGVNCLYALVEDLGGYMGFDLRGTISAYGLMPMPALGTEVSFKPCDCNFSPTHAGAQPSAAAERAGAEFDDRQVVQAIVKIAEARRTARGGSGKK